MITLQCALIGKYNPDTRTLTGIANAISIDSAVVNQPLQLPIYAVWHGDPDTYVCRFEVDEIYLDADQLPLEEHPEPINFKGPPMQITLEKWGELAMTFGGVAITLGNTPYFKLRVYAEDQLVNTFPFVVKRAESKLITVMQIPGSLRQIHHNGDGKINKVKRFISDKGRIT